MSSSDDARSTTKSGVANGTIEITNKDKQKQDISALNRDTTNTLNKLDQIFDKGTVKERQELAGLFAELAYNSIHKPELLNPEQRAAAHALIGFIAADLAGTKNLGSSMFVAGINELVVQELTKDKKSKDYYDKHPDELQWISAAIGSAVSGMTGGNISGGASITASGTKNNFLEKLPVIGSFVKDLVKKALVYKDQEGRCTAKYMSISGGEVINGSVNIVSTENMVFEGGNVSLGISSFPVDASIYEIKMYKSKEDSFDVDYWVNNWEEFKSQISGISISVSGSVGISGTASMTKEGYVLVYSGVSVNPGVQVSGSKMLDGINKDEYIGG